ncbi:MAG: SDR family oxidoreductase, partial [Gammaproteobacteria bacterium]|nr:SDR family oxidoreductase [Gammaproteobacteria bacterium]
LGLVADAGSQEAMGKVIDTVEEKLGKLDILVNNAGIGGPELDSFLEMDLEPTDDSAPAPTSAFLSTTDEMWEQAIRYNLSTTFSSSTAAMPRMNDGGSIINISSIAALGAAAQSPGYGAAKAAVIHLTKSLAQELAPRKIRVNCICPGLLWTRAWELLASQIKMTQKEMANMTNRQVFEGVVAQMTPLGEEQTPEDIGRLAVFFSSEEARMITGQVVAVDGGITLNGGM